MTLIFTVGIIQSINFNTGHITNSTIDNSNVSDININNGSMSNMNLTNSSSIQTVGLTSSGIYGVKMVSGYIHGLSADSSSSIYFLDLDDASLYSTYLSGTNMIELTVKSAFFDNSDTGVITGQTIGPASFIRNTINYQTQIEFSAADNQGNIGNYAMPLMVVPTGFFISSLITDSNTLTIGEGDSPIFNIGLSGNDRQSGLDDDNGAVNLLSEKVWCFDISNGEVSCAKATNSTIISGDIKTNTITSGSMSLEIILKNTNYYYTND